MGNKIEGPFQQCETWNNGDFLLRASLLAVGDILLFKHLQKPDIKLAEIECRVNTFFKQRKSATYTWAESDGLTRWLADKLGINLFKGLNLDQLRAYWLYMYLVRDRKTAIKHLLGFIFRLGFTPSLMENILFRPHAAVMLLATIWKPLRFLVYPLLYISAKRNLKEPIIISTTNKITLLPTLLALGWKVPGYQYLRSVYMEYFKRGTSLYPLGQHLAIGIDNNRLTKL